VEYMAALLTSFRDDKDKASLYLNEARLMGIKVDVPDVNQSFSDYTPSLTVDKTIVFGMAAVRNVGEALVEKIVAERAAAGPFTSVHDFVRRVDPAVLNRRTMESLIKAGAFDSLGVSRLGFSMKVDELIDVTLSRRKDLSLGITTLFAALADSAESNDWEGTEIVIPNVEYDKSVKLEFEREMLGTYISDHPLYGVESILATKTDGTVDQLKDNALEISRSPAPFRVGGIFTEVQLRKTKDDKDYARTVLEDLGGSVEINVSSKAFTKVAGMLVKDAIVVVKVRVDFREDEPRFSVLEIETIKVDQGPQELRLQMPREGLNAQAIATLREILTRHPGPSPVVLEAGAQGQAFRLGDDFKVSIAAVAPDLREVFGRGIIR